MKTRMERLWRERWEPVAIFENDAEALRLLPSTARVLGCSVRIVGFEDFGAEPLPRGVIQDYLQGIGDVLRFTPQ
jgi:hypothetical protein